MNGEVRIVVVCHGDSFTRRRTAVAMLNEEAKSCGDMDDMESVFCDV